MFRGRVRLAAAARGGRGDGRGDVSLWSPGNQTHGPRLTTGTLHHVLTEGKGGGGERERGGGREKDRDFQSLTQYIVGIQCTRLRLAQWAIFW